MYSGEEERFNSSVTFSSCPHYFAAETIIALSAIAVDVVQLAQSKVLKTLQSRRALIDSSSPSAFLTLMASIVANHVDNLASSAP